MIGNVYHRKDGRFEARLPLGKIKNKRKYRYFYGSTREEAESKLIKAHNLNESEYILTEMTVKDVTMEYLAVLSPRLKESSMANYRMKAEKHIYPVLGEIKCDMINHTDIQDFIAQKLKYGLCILCSRYVPNIDTGSSIIR